jgi:chorismate mutase
VTTDSERLSTPVQAELSRLRDEIERVDRAVIELIAKRVQIAREVGAAKRAAGLPTLDPAREASLIRQVAVLAREAKLPEDDVRQIFWHIIGLSRRAQLDNE